MSDNIIDQRIEDGRAIQDMVKTQGWQVLKRRIEEEINEEYDLIRNFEIEKKPTQEILAEYLDHRARLNSFEAVLDFIDEFLKNIK